MNVSMSLGTKGFFWFAGATALVWAVIEIVSFYVKKRQKREGSVEHKQFVDRIARWEDEMGSSGNVEELRAEFKERLRLPRKGWSDREIEEKPLYTVVSDSMPSLKFEPFKETASVQKEYDYIDQVARDVTSSRLIVQQDGGRAYVTTEQKTERPSWPKVWMDMASIVASRSYDPRLQVGCVVIPADNTGILSLGYNGNARGLPNEPESTEPGQSGFLHAELNALIKCDYNHPKQKHLYVTHSPCRACAKLIIQGGISRVVYKELYRDDSSIKLMRDAGIEVLSYGEALITT